MISGRLRAAERPGVRVIMQNGGEPHEKLQDCNLAYYNHQSLDKYLRNVKMVIVFTIAFYETLPQSESPFTIRATSSNFMAHLGNIAFYDNLHHFKKVFIAANSIYDLDYGVPYALDSII